QASVRSEARRDFYLYANAWWKGFSSTSKVLSKRSVKIFAEDERGQHRCVCSFLEPYRQGRMLPTPRHAARFVSLLPFRPRSTVGEQPPATQRAWNSPHAFLAAGTGDASDHALLLCSLLLGFGLDALVCCGLVHPSDDDNGDGDASGAEPGGVGVRGGDSDGNRGEETGHMWVCTFSGSRADKKAVFWESLTGQRFAMNAPRPRPSRGKNFFAGSMAVTPRHFSKVSCMFNHREFLANKQSDNRVGTTSLDISDPKLWKPMDSSRIVPKGHRGRRRIGGEAACRGVAGGQGLAHVRFWCFFSLVVRVLIAALFSSIAPGRRCGTMPSATFWGPRCLRTSRSACAEPLSAATTSRMPFKGQYQTGKQAAI
ncbi:unnamed protein product, partial [Ectocarpus sp. 6 AP-2014]